MKQIFFYSSILFGIQYILACAVIKDAAMRTMGTGSFDVTVTPHTDLEYPPTDSVQILTHESQLPELYIDLAGLEVVETIIKKDFLGMMGGEKSLDTEIRDKLIKRDLVPRAKKIGADILVIMRTSHHVKYSYRQSSMAYAPKGATDPYRHDTHIVEVLAIKLKSVANK